MIVARRQIRMAGQADVAAARSVEQLAIRRAMGLMTDDAAFAAIGFVLEDKGPAALAMAGDARLLGHRLVVHSPPSSVGIVASGTIHVALDHAVVIRQAKLRNDAGMTASTDVALRSTQRPTSLTVGRVAVQARDIRPRMSTAIPAVEVGLSGMAAQTDVRARAAGQRIGSHDRGEGASEADMQRRWPVAGLAGAVIHQGRVERAREAGVGLGVTVLAAGVAHGLRLAHRMLEAGPTDLPVPVPCDAVYWMAGRAAQALRVKRAHRFGVLFELGLMTARTDRVGFFDLERSRNADGLAIASGLIVRRTRTVAGLAALIGRDRILQGGVIGVGELVEALSVAERAVLGAEERGARLEGGERASFGRAGDVNRVTTQAGRLLLGILVTGPFAHVLRAAQVTALTHRVGVWSGLQRRDRFRIPVESVPIAAFMARATALIDSRVHEWTVCRGREAAGRFRVAGVAIGIETAQPHVVDERLPRCHQGDRLRSRFLASVHGPPDGTGDGQSDEHGRQQQREGGREDRPVARSGSWHLLLQE